MTIHVPSEFVGPVLALCQERRGVQKGMQYAAADRVIVTYELPFAEVLFDFHDRLKSISRGYASMDYELLRLPRGQARQGRHSRERRAPRCSVDHRPQGKSYLRGRGLAEKLKEFVPRQQYEVAIQAAIGGKIIARETVKALRKDVTAKCYGGDISRKRKLLEKQKEGKKRMKQVGSVEIPQQAFLAILKVE